MSRSLGNQIMNIGQLIEYSMRNNFLEKLYTKCGGSVFLNKIKTEHICGSTV